MSTETTRRATVEDLYNAPDDGMYELVDGRLVHMPLSGFGHSLLTDEIRDALRLYQKATGIGYAFSDGIGYLVDLPRRQSFGPDASYSLVRPDDEDLFITGAPVFAVEIRSKNDYGPQGDREAATKRDDYFTAGTRAVWDVNRGDRTIALYTPDTADAPQTFGLGETAHAEPALPGWRVAVDDLFR